MSDDSRGRFRAHARRKVRLRVVVSHLKAGWSREANVLDLGLGGACVGMAEPLASGDFVTLSFVAPTMWDPLSLGARVAWCSPVPVAERREGRHGVQAGLAFEPQDASSVFALFELLATLDYDD